MTLPTSYKVDTSVNTHEYTLQFIARVARIECIHVTSSCAKTRYELITSVFTRHEWWRRHHLPERSQTRNKYFLARVVPCVRHTRVFVKFKSSCTVYNYSYECLKLKSQNKTVALTFVHLAEATIFILWLLEYCLSFKYKKPFSYSVHKNTLSAVMYSKAVLYNYSM